MFRVFFCYNNDDDKICEKNGTGDVNTNKRRNSFFLF
jgi:hypothetical protein